MPDTGKSFRSSLMGGFNREDVVKYISERSEEHKKEVEKLKAELAEAEKLRRASVERSEQLSSVIDAKEEERAALESELTKARGRISVLESDLRLSEDSLKASEDELKSLKAELAGKTGENAELAKKCEALNQVISGQAERLDDFAQSKLRVADMELAAFERARVIERKAEQDAAEMIKRTKELFSDARDCFASAQISSAARIMSLVKELNGIIAEVERVPERFAAINAEIQRIERCEHGLEPEDNNGTEPCDG